MAGRGRRNEVVGLMEIVFLVGWLLIGYVAGSVHGWRLRGRRIVEEKQSTRIVDDHV